MTGRSAAPPEVPSEPSTPERGAFGAYSSPPCFMHEIDSISASAGSSPHSSIPSRGSDIRETDWPTISRWRKEARAKLIERRLGISSEDRNRWSARINEALRSTLPSTCKPLIGFYWPFRGEFDARPLLTELSKHGARLALPVVVEKARPLQFRPWTPGMDMTRGVWNIPIPAEDEAVDPDVLIAPLVGFDPAGYRLGYGGGFYDRTIASSPTKPLIIGVGFALARLETIHPQAHDVPMDLIVTEEGAWRRPI